MPDTIQAVTRFPLDSSWSRSATPFLMSPYTLSTRHQRFAYAHLQISHLTGSCPAFSVTLTTLTLNQRSSRWFGNYSWKSLPEGHPPSFLQLRANPSCSRGTPVPYERDSRIRFLDSNPFYQTGNQTGTPIWRITLLSDKLSKIMNYSWFWQRILYRKIFNFYFTLMRSP